ncbi:MAG: CBS domain-containing protein [Candidatus Hydrothermarchaeales archaeon]
MALEGPPGEEKKVGDIMQEDVISVNFNTPVSEVIKIMKGEGISGLVVVDLIGEVVGVVSTLDVFKTFMSKTKVDSLVAEDIMTPYIINVVPEDSIFNAASIMLENNIHRLVVVVSPSRRRPIGIVTATDVINNI